MPADVALTILGMAVVTYGMRVAGLWLMARVTPSPRVEAWLGHIPGAVLIAIVAPAAVLNGAADALAAGVAAAVAIWTRSILPTLAAGVIAVWALRHLL